MRRDLGLLALMVMLVVLIAGAIAIVVTRLTGG